MRRINYAEAVIGTDPVVADLVIDYATRLAGVGRADSVAIPAVRGDGSGHDGPVQQVTLLLGPASQITAWTDDRPFPVDGEAAVTDLRRRIRLLTVVVPAAEDFGLGLDDLDDLDGVRPPG